MWKKFHTLIDFSERCGLRLFALRGQLAAAVSPVVVVVVVWCGAATAGGRARLQWLDIHHPRVLTEPVLVRQTLSPQLFSNPQRVHFLHLQQNWISWFTWLCRLKMNLFSHIPVFVLQHPHKQIINLSNSIILWWTVGWSKSYLLCK